MNFQVSRFGGGAEETQILLFTLCVLLISSSLILFLPRRYIIVPLILTSVLIPLGQVLVIGPFHFLVFRILILVGWVRLIGSGVIWNPKSCGFQINSIDRMFVLWCFSSVFTFLFLYPNLDALINRTGFLYSTAGTYFLLRFVIQNNDGFDRLIRVLAVICVIVAIVMVIEQVMGRNVFSVFGGVPENSIIRDGRIRSQGPFAHAILAGTFGAVLVPLFVGLWQQAGRARVTAALGIVSATVMAIASASSTALAVYAAGIVGLCFWPFRGRMRQLRWGVVILLIVLHMIMEAPVWALIGRVDLIGASSGYQRYMLIDQTIRHFGDWWLFGVQDTAGWGWDMGDTSNQFVETAVTGGLVTLVFSIALIARCFQRIGIARKSWESPGTERRLWALGVCLFANVFAFFGITYFDQTVVVWYALLAMIASVRIAEDKVPQEQARFVEVPRCATTMG